MSANIQEQSLNIYNENISYLEKNQPQLFKKISAFELALQKGYYEAKYELEYLEDTYFDVKELKTSNYLYGSNSLEYAQSMAKSIDYRKEDNTFIVSPRYHFSKETLEILQDSNIQDNSPQAIANIIAYINHSVIPENSTMKRLEKFIFFGTGLGVHITEVNKKIDSDFYLIVEDDLELFYLSLFVTDYKALAEDAVLYFVVFDEVQDTKNTMIDFLKDGFMHNHYIKFLQTLHQDEKKLKVMQEVIASQDHITFPFHAYFNKFLRPLIYFKEHYKFLNLRTQTKFFDAYPVLIAAAGPSLQKNLQWLKKNQHKFVIIALTSALKTLEKEQIIPDIITHVDPYKKGSLPHLEKLQDKSYLQNAIALLAEQSPPEILKNFNKENVYLFQNGSNLKMGYGIASASCVGSMSYALSLHLRAQEIYLLGLDLALDSETASTHSSSHPSARSLDTSNIDKLEEVFKLKESVIKVKGNFQDEVMTTASFAISIDGVNGNTAVYKQNDQSAYNLSDGAYFNGIKPTKIDSLDLSKFQDIDKKKLHKQLKEKFEKNSSDTITSQELELIKKMLIHTKNIKKMLLKHIEHKYQNEDSYKYALYDLALNITNNDKQEANHLNFVLLYYIQFIFPYIFDMLNTKEVTNITTHIEKVDTMLTDKLLDIVNYFEERYEEFFEE